MDPFCHVIITAESVCETEIKVRQHGGYTVLAVVLAVLALGLVGANKARFGGGGGGGARGAGADS